jgi:hypothetical protein
MNAVDSTIRPEIEDQDPAAIIGERAPCAGGVQPIESNGKIRRANGGRFHDEPRLEEQAS